MNPISTARNIRAAVDPNMLPMNAETQPDPELGHAGPRVNLELKSRHYILTLFPSKRVDEAREARHPLPLARRATKRYPLVPAVSLLYMYKYSRPTGRLIDVLIVFWCEMRKVRSGNHTRSSQRTSKSKLKLKLKKLASL